MNHTIVESNDENYEEFNGGCDNSSLVIFSAASLLVYARQDDDTMAADAEEEDDQDEDQDWDGDDEDDNNNNNNSNYNEARSTDANYIKSHTNTTITNDDDHNMKKHSTTRQPTNLQEGEKDEDDGIVVVVNDDNDDGTNAVGSSKMRMASVLEVWMETLSSFSSPSSAAAAALSSSILSSSVPYQYGLGRRIAVRWSKNQYYNGTITHFDPITGRHTVTYDDGDIRTYTNLSKKTIQWL